jgi:hypothetical protein
MQRQPAERNAVQYQVILKDMEPPCGLPITPEHHFFVESDKPLGIIPTKGELASICSLGRCQLEERIKFFQAPLVACKRPEL